MQYTSSKVCTLNFIRARFVYFTAIPTILQYLYRKLGARLNLVVTDTRTQRQSEMEEHLKSPKNAYVILKPFASPHSYSRLNFKSTIVFP